MNSYNRLRLRRWAPWCIGIAMILALAGLCIMRVHSVGIFQPAYYIPKHDIHCITGTATPAGTRETINPKQGLSISFYLPAVYSEQRLELYLINEAANEVYFNAQLYDEEENLIAESGLIYNGEYLPYLTLDEPLDEQKEYMLKIISFHPQKLTSEGSVWIRLGNIKGI